MANSERTNNMVPSLQVKSNAADSADVILWADPSTHRLLVDATLTGGGTSMTDDAAFTPGTTAGTPIFGFFDDVAPDSVNEGDGGVIRMSGNRNLYTQIRDAAGNERGANVNASNQLAIAGPVTNAGTFVVQVDGAALTALQLIDDPVIADDAAFTPATTKVMMAGFEFDDVAPDSVDEGDAGAARMSARREIYVQLRDAAGNERGLNIDASGQIAITHAALTELAGAINASAQMDVNIAANGIGLATSAKQDTIIGHVDGIEALLTTIDADTGNIDTSLNNIETAIQIMDDWDNAASDGASVSGDVAHDSADAGEPVKVGFKAVALKANPTEVAANDRSNWIGDVSGVPFVLPGHPNILSQSLQVTDGDGAQTDAAIITAGANVAIVVTKVSVMADNANTVDVSVRIGFGTANTPAADAAQVLLFHPGIAAGSGVVEGSGSGILGIGASGEDVRVTCEDPVTGSINIIVTYFTTDI